MTNEEEITKLVDTLKGHLLGEIMLREPQHGQQGGYAPTTWSRAAWELIRALDAFRRDSELVPSQYLSQNIYSGQTRG